MTEFLRNIGPMVQLTDGAILKGAEAKEARRRHGLVEELSKPVSEAAGVANSGLGDGEQAQSK